MYPMHPLIALDLARDRSREHAQAAERWRLGSLATPGAVAAGPDRLGTPGEPGRARRAIASVLRTVAMASGKVAGSAGRAAARLDSGPAWVPTRPPRPQ